MADGASHIVKEVVGTSVALVVGIADNRQITFQTGFAEDESDDVVNARLDRTMRFADRLQAVYLIPSLVAERRKLQDELDQYEQDIAEAERNHERAQASLDVQIVQIRETQEATRQQGYDEHVRTGRMTAYKPVGAIKATIERCEIAVKDAEAKKQANENERRQFLDNIELSIKRRRDRLVLLGEQIAEAEAKIT